MYHIHQFCGRIRCVVMVLLLVCLLVFSVTADDLGRNSLNKGASALQFGVNQNGEIPNVETFLGTTLSYKKHLTPKSCFRFGLSTTIQNSEDEAEYSYMEIDDVMRKRIENTDRNLYDISITCQYIYYPTVSGKVIAFFGGGPLIGYNNSDRERHVIDYLLNDPEKCKLILDVYSNGIRALQREKRIDVLAFIEKASGGTVGLLRLAGALSIETQITNII